MLEYLLEQIDSLTVRKNLSRRHCRECLHIFARCIRLPKIEDREQEAKHGRLLSQARFEFFGNQHGQNCDLLEFFILLAQGGVFMLQI
jgi:hypothetical protein